MAVGAPVFVFGHPPAAGGLNTTAPHGPAEEAGESRPAQPPLFVFGVPQEAPGVKEPACQPTGPPIFVFGLQGDGQQDAVEAAAPDPVTPRRQHAGRGRSSSRKSRPSPLLRSARYAGGPAGGRSTSTGSLCKGQAPVTEPDVRVDAELADARAEAEQQGMSEIRRLARDRAHAPALARCLCLLDGPPAVAELASRLCADWGEAERRQIAEGEARHNSLTAQLMAARDTGDELRRLLKMREAALDGERGKSRAAYAKVLDLEQENARLRQQARDRPPPSSDDLVKPLARLECSALRCSEADERTALRKKLLFKWHPDKQPCPASMSFATRVMQEMQNRPEWAP